MKHNETETQEIIDADAQTAASQTIQHPGLFAHQVFGSYRRHDCIIGESMDRECLQREVSRDGEYIATTEDTLIDLEDWI